MTLAQLAGAGLKLGACTNNATRLSIVSNNWPRSLASEIAA